MTPSAISTSLTWSERPKEMLLPTPERFLSGATVITSPTRSSARRAARSPGASMPSSLVNTMRITSKLSVCPEVIIFPKGS